MDKQELKQKINTLNSELELNDIKLSLKGSPEFSKISERLDNLQLTTVSNKDNLKSIKTILSQIVDEVVI